MLIDWFTVLAQAVNFLVLVFVLKRFLFKPIMRAMREREERIANDLAEAERAREEAVQTSLELKRERESLAEEKRLVLAEAAEEAKKWRERAMERAEEDVRQAKKLWLESLEDEKAAFSRNLKARIADQVFMVCRKVLKDLADGELETRLIDSFMRKAAKGEFELGENGSKGPILVRTGFELNPEGRELVRRTLADLVPDSGRIKFERRPELGFGLQLLVGDVKAEWNAARYMKNLEQEVMGEFKVQGEQD